MDITWQQCFVPENYGADSYCIDKFNNGFLIGIQVTQGMQGVSNYHGGTDAWFVCVDSLGNMLWERCYGGSGGDVPIKIVNIDAEFSYLICATTSTDGDVLCQTNRGGDVWVVKIDTAGNIIWENCYGGPGYDEPRDAILTPDGGLLIMSRIFAKGGNISNFYGLPDNWVCKLDSIGNIEWETTIGSPGMDNGLRLLRTSGSTYLALCSVNANGGMSECELTGAPYYSLDLWLVEIDMDGNILRQDCYGGSEWELGRDIVETSDGFVILASTDSPEMGVHNEKTDFWLLKINKNREIMWQNSLGGTAWDFPDYITKTQDNGFILFGATSSHDKDVSGNHSVSTASFDIWMVKTDSTGELLWQQCIGSAGSEYFLGRFCVAKKSDYNFVLAPITGYGPGFGCSAANPEHPYSNVTINIKDCSHYQPTTPQKPTGQDFLCVNTDSITQYTTQPANGAWYYEWKLLPENSGTITQNNVTAQIQWNPTYEGSAIIKVRSSNDCGTSEWSDSLTVQTYMCLGSEEYNDSRSIFNIYPNPVSNKLSVSYYNQISNKSVTIEILNMYGTIVIKQDMPKEQHTLDIDVTKLLKSLYLIRAVENGVVVGVKKLVVE